MTRRLAFFRPASTRPASMPAPPLPATQAAPKARPPRWVPWLVGGVVLLPLLAGLCLVLSNQAVVRAAQGRLYADTALIPARRVGVVLGTSKYTARGRINQFYQYRIDAAVALYEAHKVQYLIVSGDNSTTHYDEPTTMRRDLIARGVPATHIRRDYAGFRTLDSVVRAQKVFGQSEYTVISQPFHNERAIFLARARGQDVIGFNAADVGGAGGRRVQMREYLARVAAVLDVVFGVQPRFLGAPESLEGDMGSD